MRELVALMLILLTTKINIYDAKTHAMLVAVLLVALNDTLWLSLNISIMLIV